MMPPNMITAQTDTWWYSHQSQIEEAITQYGEGNPSPLRSLLNARFESGARWNLAMTTRLSPHVQQFIEMLVLLGYAEVSREGMEQEESSGETEGASGEPDSGL